MLAGVKKERTKSLQQTFCCEGRQFSFNYRFLLFRFLKLSSSANNLDIANSSLQRRGVSQNSALLILALWGIERAFENNQLNWIHIKNSIKEGQIWVSCQLEISEISVGQNLSYSCLINCAKANSRGSSSLRTCKTTDSEIYFFNQSRKP